MEPVLLCCTQHFINFEIRKGLQIHFFHKLEPIQPPRNTLFGKNYISLFIKIGSKINFFSKRSPFSAKSGLIQGENVILAA